MKLWLGDTSKTVGRDDCEGVALEKAAEDDVRALEPTELEVAEPSPPDIDAAREEEEPIPVAIGLEESEVAIPELDDCGGATTFSMIVAERTEDLPTTEKRMETVPLKPAGAVPTTSVLSAFRLNHETAGVAVKLETVSPGWLKYELRLMSKGWVSMTVTDWTANAADVVETPRLDTVALRRDGDVVDTADVPLPSDCNDAETPVGETRAALDGVPGTVGENVTAEEDEEDAAATTKNNSMVYIGPGLAEPGRCCAVTVAVMFDGG